MDRAKVSLLIIIALSVVVSLPLYSKQWHLLWHIFGVVIFLGNIIVSAAWMSAARRTEDVKIVAFAARAVSHADWMFTLPSVILILLNGIALTGKEYGYANVQDQSWLTAAMLLFVLSGVVWAGFLMRYQARMIRLSANAEGEVSPELRETIKSWMNMGGLATLLPLVSLWLMVVKPMLW